MSEEYNGEERRHGCSPENRCTDMVKVIVWGKATRYFMGGGVLLLVLSSFVGTASQIKSTGQIAVMNNKIEDLSVAIGALRDTVEILNDRLETVQRKQSLQDFDMTLTRHKLNDVLRKMGIDSLDPKPFEPPDLFEIEDFSRRMKEKKEKHKHKEPKE